MEGPVKIGISSCLLGEAVRWNGSHSRDSFLTDTLGLYVSYVPVCPEMECGFGVPRDPFHLAGDPKDPRLVVTKTGQDVTDRMKKWADERVRSLEKEMLCGFIFKKNSPSSGLMRVKVFNDKGQPVRKGAGIFAKAFTDHFPLIPVEEDGRLNDPVLRENFVAQIFTMMRWRDTVKRRFTLSGLIDFHTDHKLLILSHSPVHYRAMGKLVAAGKTYAVEDMFKTYESMLLGAMRLKPTEKKNANVLQHIMGYFKKVLSSDEKQELLEIIDQYKQKHVPLIVPVTLMNHFVRKYEEPYLARQVYLNPHPISLKLRNHA